MDVRAETGIETYVNDEPGDPNPGVMVDCRENRGRALTSEQARELAAELNGRADYFDSLQEAVSTVNKGQIEKAEQLLGYLEQHAEQLVHGPEAVHREWWMGSAASLLRDLLPSWSAFKEED